MKQLIRTAAFAMALALASTSCTKDKAEIPVPPPPADNVQKVTLSQTTNIDLDMIANAPATKGMEYELSMSGSPIETFTFNNDTRKLWHLGKLDLGKHRINLHVNGPDGSSAQAFIRYDVSDGKVTHSVSPTPVIGNNLAFDLIVEP
jgi:hypothetical protein